MTYYVTMKISGRFVVEVEADSIEEAKQEAGYRFSEADFGELEDIDGEPISVEDQEGDYVWED